MKEFIEKYKKFKEYVETENTERRRVSLEVQNETGMNMIPIFLEPTLDEFIKWLEADELQESSGGGVDW
jgi:hypothetical protein